MSTSMEAARPKIKVAAICGSLRKASCNRGLIRCGEILSQLPPNLLPSPFFSTFSHPLLLSPSVPVTCEAMEICNESIDGIQVELLDISSLPFVNTDLEDNGTYPQAVEEFRRAILESDSILFAFPEYNYSLPGPQMSVQTRRPR